MDTIRETDPKRIQKWSKNHPKSMDPSTPLNVHPSTPLNSHPVPAGSAPDFEDPVPDSPRGLLLTAAYKSILQSEKWIYELFEWFLPSRQFPPRHRAYLSSAKGDGKKSQAHIVNCRSFSTLDTFVDKNGRIQSVKSSETRSGHVYWQKRTYAKRKKFRNALCCAGLLQFTWAWDFLPSLWELKTLERVLRCFPPNPPCSLLASFSVRQKDAPIFFLSKLTKKWSKVIENRWILVDGDQEAQGGTRSSEARERS